MELHRNREFSPLADIPISCNKVIATCNPVFSIRREIQNTETEQFRVEWTLRCHLAQASAGTQ